MARYTVIRDIGFDIAGKHFSHGEVFKDTDLIVDLPPGADKDTKAAQLAARAAAEKAIKQGLTVSHIEAETVTPAAAPAEKEG